ncbi:hypothetical protein A2686_01890 [Candidatus Woesebacteria bacterium RIFCSPHIGHO2_01_FULL_38_10]|uniref:Uncharacterized protein n=1 Tax=Candidatus Woesebacteria bacterium RIFCSPLOWO2_01_FULL_39_10b TaxID=1802517 RepID=A0A1F8B714_9BACT|nr:MAG: hypothetical protein A2686_01890 [Candidatus Woesebacteria bacterium RIFCSPHIGHO2_01_FULL_38_10]OGM59834.1 MAG: hypothetical protein A2892_00910 [Candidatus Woesebacteria bacterium RIFCSPLOWO2_01_FULL_39_10b]
MLMANAPPHLLTQMAIPKDTIMVCWGDPVASQKMTVEKNFLTQFSLNNFPINSNLSFTYNFTHQLILKQLLCLVKENALIVRFFKMVFAKIPAI